MHRRTLARSYEQEGVELDAADRDKLQMLDSYMASVEGADADAPEPEEDPADLAPMPTKIEDVDKFMERAASQYVLAWRTAGSAHPEQEARVASSLRPIVPARSRLCLTRRASRLPLFLATAEAVGCRRLRRGETAQRG